QSFVPGTATGITLTANANVGDGNAYPTGYHAVGGAPTGTALQMKATGAGTLVEGDILTFAGDNQTYVVTQTANLSATATGVYVYPGLQVAQPGATSTPVAVTKLAAHVMNVAFHR